jgi:tetrahydromethanopterin S-methyltransferase subunit G
MREAVKTTPETTVVQQDVAKSSPNASTLDAGDIQRRLDELQKRIEVTLARLSGALAARH